VDERRSLRTTAQRSPLFWRPGSLKEAERSSSRAKLKNKRR
jgi:hypothetical protein